MICYANQLTGFYVMVNLAFNELNRQNQICKSNQLTGYNMTGLLAFNEVHAFFYKQRFYKKRQVEID